MQQEPPMNSNNTPVLVGVGQYTQAVPDDLSRCLGYADIATEAARKAIDDCGPGVMSSIDWIAAVRTFEDSLPAPASFGRSTNLAGSVAGRLGLKPVQTVYEVLGGQSPQKLVGEFCAKLYRGECSAVLLFGAEVIANIRALQRAMKAGFPAPDWNESSDCPLEDRGPGLDASLIGPEDIRHQLMQPMQFYALMENARRASTGLSRQVYRQQMGELFAPFSRVAAQNPFAFFPEALTPEEIIESGPGNPMLADPYCRNLVAKDRVNQAAAVVLTTVGRARQMDISEDKWVYLHAHSDTRDSHLLEREDLGASVAMQAAIDHCLKQTDMAAEDIAHYDLYSCFPVVVFNAVDRLGVDPARQILTQTGGLPYFGGPGNNYSMHGLVSLADTLRGDRGAHGLLLANGGWMSKCSVGIYSTTPVADWAPVSSTAPEAAIEARNGIEPESHPDGAAVIETYTVNYTRGEPVDCVVIARLEKTRKRCYAVNRDAEVVRQFSADEFEPLGQSISVRYEPAGNSFRLG
jgi:acetyl-CoA C-acetyltransferase